MNNARELDEVLANLGSALNQVGRAVSAFGVSMARVHDIVLSGAERVHLLSRMKLEDPPKLFCMNGVPFKEPVRSMRTHAGKLGAVFQVGENFVVLDLAEQTTITAECQDLLEVGLAALLNELERKVQNESA